MVLAFGVAPGTVLASSATDVYTEEPPPPTPNKTGGNNNGNSGNGSSNSGDSGSSGSTGSSTGSSGSSGTDDGSGSSGSDGNGKKKLKKYSNGTYNPATDGDKDKAGADTDDSDDSTISAAPASGGDDDGGSALPWIIAIVIGVPLIGGGAYYLWKRYQTPDDETRDKLKSALGKAGTGTGSSTGS